jgi:hypothetical protein
MSRILANLILLFGVIMVTLNKDFEPDRFVVRLLGVLRGTYARLDAAKCSGAFGAN